MLEDPRVNFAVSKRGLKTGVDHLGIQVESEPDLATLREQIVAAQIVALEQANTQCCYARSDKYWLTDPQGVAWETFHTLESVPIYGETERPEIRACCEPTSNLPAKSSACCA